MRLIGPIRPIGHLEEQCSVLHFLGPLQLLVILTANPQQKPRHYLPLRLHLLQRFQRLLFYRIVLILRMVEDEVAFVVHGEFGVPLEGEDVVTDAEPLVTAEGAGGKRRRAFR